MSVLYEQLRISYSIPYLLSFPWIKIFTFYFKIFSCNFGSTNRTPRLTIPCTAFVIPIMFTFKQ